MKVVRYRNKQVMKWLRRLYVANIAECDHALFRIEARVLAAAKKIIEGEPWQQSKFI